jgi:ADP-ribose pyrophosphatase
MNFDYIWRKLSTQSVLKTPYYDVRVDRLKHPQGHELDYYVIAFARQAAGVVPVAADGRVLLVQQWRHPVEKLTWSIPAGAIESGESPADAAARELREEAGCVARKLDPLYHYHPSIGVADLVFHVFVAQDVELKAERERGEIHEVQFFTRPQIEALIDHNEIVDGMSLTGLLMWLRKSPRVG